MRVKSLITDFEIDLKSDAIHSKKNRHTITRKSLVKGIIQNLYLAADTILYPVEELYS